jgi:hypothetical protein
VRSVPHSSRLEPMFWLHHGMVDKVWADYQKADPKNAQAFGGSASGIAPPTTRVTYNVSSLQVSIIPSNEDYSSTR